MAMTASVCLRTTVLDGDTTRSRRSGVEFPLLLTLFRQTR